ncbi:MAG TPA: hypothetical protein VKA48_07955, partial [Gammaproteobacteria bacterium]|nr:hypothetical protein [Gammaproteobacteria bacterium]
IENADFTEWSGTSPAGWSVEGGAEAEAMEEGLLLRTSGDGGFIFQQAESPERFRGTSVTLAAWVKTGLPDGVFLEFSNRAGTDVRSEAHPGDGNWQRLELTTRVPGTEGAVEFRVRAYSPGKVLVKGPMLAAGYVPPAGYVGPVVDLGPWSAGAAVLGLTLFMAAILMYFRRRRSTLHGRLFEAAALGAGVAASAAAADGLFGTGGLGSGVGTNVRAVASNLAWGAFGAGAVVYAASAWAGRHGWSSLMRPVVLYIASYCVALALLLNFLATGRTGAAEDAALALYLLVAAGAVARMASGARAWFVEKYPRPETVRMEMESGGETAGARPGTNAPGMSKAKSQGERRSVHEGSPYQAQLSQPPHNPPAGDRIHKLVPEEQGDGELHSGRAEPRP